MTRPDVLFSDDPSLAQDPVIEGINVAARRAVDARLDTIKMIKQVADEVDAIAKEEKERCLWGGAASIIGGMATVAGGVIMVATAGAATPIAVPICLWGATAVGAVGSVTKLVANDKSVDEQTKSVARLKDALEKDIRAFDELNRRMKLLSGPTYEHKWFKVIKSGGCISAGVVAYVITNGWRETIELLKVFFVDLWSSTIGRLFSSTVVKAAEVAASTVANTTLSTTGTSLAVKEITEEVSQEAAKAAAKSMGRVVGGATAVLGIVFLVMDAYTLHKDRTQNNKLAKDLRALAADLEQLWK